MASKRLDPSLAVEMIGVEKSFGLHQVCRGVNLPIKKGRVLTIMGPSGCGKTITIKMLIGLILPDTGSILFDNIDIASLTNEDDFLSIRRRISMVFQGAALFDALNVFDNIAYPLRISGVPLGGELEDRVYMSLALVGLPEVGAKMPSELSGGMKKRVGLARAIVTNPEIILYDEPTTGLDPVNTRRISDLILLLQERLKCTSIVVTHDMPVAERISHDVAFMFNGRVRQMGTFLQLKESNDAIVRGFVVGDPSVLLTAHGSI